MCHKLLKEIKEIYTCIGTYNGHVLVALDKVILIQRDYTTRARCLQHFFTFKGEKLFQIPFKLTFSNGPFQEFSSMLNFPSLAVKFSETETLLVHGAARHLVDDRGRVARVALEHVFISSQLTGVRAFVMKMAE